MILVPGQDWTWNYVKKGAKQHLALDLVSDDNQNFSFVTHYNVNELKVHPDPGQSFCIEDGILLTAFQQGLYDIGVEQDVLCLEIGLNALACSRFCKDSMPLSRYFSSDGNNPQAKLGQVVSLYSNDGAIGDFIVLDQPGEEHNEHNELVRLMLANPEFEFCGHYLKLGQMLRVTRDCLNQYRLKKQKKVYYA